MNDRCPVVFHYHIFKNAGTSVDFALKEFFGSSWASYEGQHAHDILAPEAVEFFLKNNPNVKAVSSHLARPSLNQSHILPIIFLREPLRRARSVYEFSRNDTSQPFNNIIREMSFEGYLEWVLSGGPGGIVVRNYQVIHLSQASFCEKGILHAVPTEQNLIEAVEFLSNAPIFGIVENYAQSIRLIESCYKKFIPELSLSEFHRNRTLASNLNIESELSKDILEKFRCQNKLDYQLYEYALKRFDTLVNKQKQDR